MTKNQIRAKLGRILLYVHQHEKITVRELGQIVGVSVAMYYKLQTYVRRERYRKEHGLDV